MIFNTQWLVVILGKVCISLIITKLHWFLYFGNDLGTVGEEFHPEVPNQGTVQFGPALCCLMVLEVLDLAVCNWNTSNCCTRLELREVNVSAVAGKVFRISILCQTVCWSNSADAARELGQSRIWVTLPKKIPVIKTAFMEHINLCIWTIW